MICFFLPGNNIVIFASTKVIRADTTHSLMGMRTRIDQQLDKYWDLFFNFEKNWFQMFYLKCFSRLIYTFSTFLDVSFGLFNLLFSLFWATNTSEMFVLSNSPIMFYFEVPFPVALVKKLLLLSLGSFFIQIFNSFSLYFNCFFKTFFLPSLSLSFVCFIWKISNKKKFFGVFEFVLIFLYTRQLVFIKDFFNSFFTIHCPILTNASLPKNNVGL